MKMRSRALCCIVVGCLAAGCERGADAPATTRYPATHDGRFGTPCYAKLNNEDQPRYCEYSMFRLAAAPELYDGQHVKVTGFLVRSVDRITIFPNKESFESGVFAESIDVPDPTDVLLKPFDGKLEAGVVGITVMGKFDATESEANGARLGALRNVRRIYVDPRGMLPAKAVRNGH